MQAYAQGYAFSSASGVPVTYGYETAADLNLKPLADLNITKVEMAAAQGFRTSSPITITVSVDSDQTPYYQYWVSRDYGGSTPDNWILLQTYTTDNSLVWTPPSEARYIIVAWVTDDPDHHAPQMGGISVTAGPTADARIGSIVANAPASGSAQAQVILTTSLAEQTTTHYYQYSVGDNYGYPPEMQSWQAITDYSGDNRGVWTPLMPGYYTTLVEVSADGGDATPEIAGMTWVMH